MLLGRDNKSVLNSTLIMLNRSKIDFVRTYKYLGLLFNCKVNMVKQAKQTLFLVTKKINT